ncbi:hypothetical protein P8C59_002794 [Phyllachora maydis]|uniref:AAA+ ATPase domain-containing protein n=1 Tax=Phyllachora maydis TaxID=1825666 RepID=A0AAD9MCN7_9PEZI|nr:hypothetical protein P8C59_002794 [Phyllachora maydis]
MFLGKTKPSDAVAPEPPTKAKPASSSVPRRAKRFSATPCSPGKFEGSGNNSTATRKSKGHAVGLPTLESIVQLATQRLDVRSVVQAIQSVDPDEFVPLPPELRLPSKHYESGAQLQARVRPELRAAVEVLQAGREVTLLKEWLQALMVQSVATGAGDADKTVCKRKSASAAAAAAAAAVMGKRRRKRKRLDNFLVSSDEEADQMSELSDTDYDLGAGGSDGMGRKTVVRTGDVTARRKDGGRLTNTVVISGPHGCGKTAAVYAVAKELGYEVFEVNPGSRRNGKDVMERIGDMTRNHLVKHHGSSKPSVDAEAAATADDGLAEDPKPGKQPTVLSFFQPKASTALPKQPTKARPRLVSAVAKEAKQIRDAKTQKQSLILLEEVDILYDEDKQFWATVMGLMAQSKRPFVLTCNDETQVPLQSLSLHAIFRFSRPPTPMAVDRLLLVAANEGHALKRDALTALYESRRHDLRAATMDLQYWCQMGVGDRKGGFDWFYPRWPRGVDLDENGDVVRVVSEDTFQRGMEAEHEHEHEHEHEGRKSWGLVLGRRRREPQPARRQTSLAAYDAFADAMSAADMSAAGAFAAFNREPLDATLPAQTSKAREDLLCGVQALDASPMIDHSRLSASMAICLESLAGQKLAEAAKTIDDDDDDDDDERAVLFPTQRQQHGRSLTPNPPPLRRADFSLALDPIAAPESALSSAQPPAHLDPSVLHRPTDTLAVDVAPYVRGIVAYERALQKQRRRLSSLVSDGGGACAKRMRTTRAALSALEGGSRTTTRAERWFRADVNPYLVMRTGGRGWSGAAAGEGEGEGEEGVGRGGGSAAAVAPASSRTLSPEVVRTGRRGRKVVMVDDGDSLDELGQPDAHHGQADG